MRSKFSNNDKKDTQIRCININPNLIKKRSNNFNSNSNLITVDSNPPLVTRNKSKTNVNLISLASFHSDETINSQKKNMMKNNMNNSNNQNKMNNQYNMNNQNNSSKMTSGKIICTVFDIKIVYLVEYKEEYATIFKYNTDIIAKGYFGYIMRVFSFALKSKTKGEKVNLKMQTSLFFCFFPVHRELRRQHLLQTGQGHKSTQGE